MPKDTLNILSFLQSHRRGEILNRADESLAQVIAEIADHGGKGEITIKLPFAVNKAGQIECTPSVTYKTPARPMRTGFYYADAEGQLTRRDPNQMDIEDEIERRRSAE